MWAPNSLICPRSKTSILSTKATVDDGSNDQGCPALCNIVKRRNALCFSFLIQR